MSTEYTDASAMNGDIARSTSVTVATSWPRAKTSARCGAAA
jgi:hypothetical protein